MTVSMTPFASIARSARWLLLAYAVLIAAGGLPSLPRAMFGGKGASWIEIGGEPTTVLGGRTSVLHAPAKGKLRLVLGPGGLPPVCPSSLSLSDRQSAAAGWVLTTDPHAKLRELTLCPDATGPPSLSA